MTTIITSRIIFVRFELIDRIIEQGPDKLVAIKSVTNSEEYLADHFPKFPVLPGVIMLETMVQAARKFLEGGAEDSDGKKLVTDDRPLIVSEVRNIRYGNMVRPGQTLKVEVTLKKHDKGKFQFQGRATVEDKPAVQGKFTLEPL